MSKLVYLAGPITGLSYDGAVNWRTDLIEKLKPLFGLSPMRNKDYLRKEKHLAAEGYNIHALSTNKGILTRDSFDCKRANLVIAYLDEAKEVSIGTVMEIGMAYIARVPIITVMKKGNIHWHGMVIEASGWIVDTLDEAVEIAHSVLIEEVA